MALDERAFFTDKPETRPGRLTCPKCRRSNEYSIRWVRRTKKDRPPAGADERDRAKFAKLRDYMIRLDDNVVCKACRTKFDIPSQHSMVFLQQGEKTSAPSRPVTAAYAGDEDEDDSRFNR
jgi:hypothetical protein